MSVHQIRRALEPNLRTHAIMFQPGPGERKRTWVGSHLLQVHLHNLKVALKDDSPPLEGEIRYYRFIEAGGIILLATDGPQLVGVATVGYCSGIWSDSLLVEDFCVVPRTSVLTDQVYAAMLKGIVSFARLMASEGEEMKPILIHLSAGDSQRRLLRRLFLEHGFQEESDAPGMWIARVKHGQEQLAVA